MPARYIRQILGQFNRVSSGITGPVDGQEPEDAFGNEHHIFAVWRPDGAIIASYPQGPMIHSFLWTLRPASYRKQQDLVNPLSVQRRIGIKSGQGNDFCIGRPGRSTHTAGHFITQLLSYSSIDIHPVQSSPLGAKTLRKGNFESIWRPGHPRNTSSRGDQIAHGTTG